MVELNDNPFRKALSADPAPLGLSAFAFTTFLLSFQNAGLLGTHTSDVVVPLAMAYGGLGQLIAGSWEMRKGNTFGFTAFSSYGAFWLFYAFLNIFGGMGILGPLHPVEIGWSLVLWGIFTFMMWFGSMFTNTTLFLTFLTLWIAFVALGAGAIYASTAATMVGGIFGLLAAFFAAFTAFAIIVNSFKPNTIPVGPPILK